MRQPKITTRAGFRRRFGIVTAVGFIIACLVTIAGLDAGVSPTLIGGMWGGFLCMAEIAYLRLPRE